MKNSRAYFFCDIIYIMKRFFVIFTTAIFLLAASDVRAEGEEPGADFSVLKEYKGENYIISYPGKGYDKQLAVLISRLNKIIPFVEVYGSTRLKDINIIVIENTSQLQLEGTVAGEFRTEGGKIYIDLPAAYYNENVVVHEVCHLLQIPFWFPSWFGEGHAENCARKYYESRGESDRVQIYNDWYGSRIKKLKNVPADVPNYIGEGNLGPGDLGPKTALEAYLLMGELAKSVSMAQFFPKIREDFVVDENGVKKPYTGLLPNDAIICKINEVSSKDIIPLFEKYGFRTPLCDDKTYDFLTPSKISSFMQDKIALMVGVGFLAVIIWLAAKSIRRRRNKKANFSR